MTPEEKEQHAEFCELLAPVRQWLDEGALHVYDETGFNMGVVFSRDPKIGPKEMPLAQGPRDYAGNECGSVMCIAGAIGQFNNLDVALRVLEDGSYSEDRDARDADEILSAMFPAIEGRIENLFYPGLDVSYYEITRAQAIRAIDNFVATGDPDWEMALIGKSR